MTTMTDATPDAPALLDAALTASHVTAADLAAALDVPTATLNAWRYGRRTMPPAMRARAAVVLLARAAAMRDAAERFAAAAEPEPTVDAVIPAQIAGPGEG